MHHLVHLEQLVVHEDLELPRLGEGLAQVRLGRITRKVLLSMCTAYTPHVNCLHIACACALHACACGMCRRLLERHLWSVEERVHGQVLERGGRLHRDLGCTRNRGCFWLYGQGVPMQVCMR